MRWCSVSKYCVNDDEWFQRSRPKSEDGLPTPRPKRGKTRRRCGRRSLTESVVLCSLRYRFLYNALNRDKDIVSQSRRVRGH